MRSYISGALLPVCRFGAKVLRVRTPDVKRAADQQFDNYNVLTSKSSVPTYETLLFTSPHYLFYVYQDNA